MRRSPHQILGVPKDAAGAEIKRAYRRLAMRWHPDRSDDPEAAARFREIRAAYERLAAVDDPDETDSAGSSERARAPDIRLNLDLTLAEAAAGCRKTVRYTRGKACPNCAGSGEAGLARTRFCAPCHGSGRVRDGGRGLATCSDCGGRGFFSERICPDCGGSGREIAEVSLKITVPPGMLAGDDLRLAGQGEPGDEERAPGDLFLTVVLRTHALFRLRGRDLEYSMPVSALTLIAGGEIRLPSLAGSLPMQLDPGSPEPREIRLAGHGYPGRGRHPGGDLLVRLEPVFPLKLNSRQRKLLLQADAALQGDASACFPEMAAWRKEHGLD
jgi:molecular chaperone DnaJ